jgi:hypothetical protein
LQGISYNWGYLEIDGNTGFTIDKCYYKRDVGMGEGEMGIMYDKVAHKVPPANENHKSSIFIFVSSNAS